MKLVTSLSCLIIVLISSCSKKQDDTPEKITAKEIVIVKDINGLMTVDGFNQLQNLLQANGERMLCVQPMYQQCMAVRRYTCESELRPFVLSCLAYAKQQVAQVVDQSNRDQYMGAYGSCLINRHAAERNNEVTDISLCLYNTELNERLGIEALIADRPFYQQN